MANGTNLAGWQWGYLGSPNAKLANQVCSLANNQDGRLEVFAIGQDNALYHKWQMGPLQNGAYTAWSDWEQLATLPNARGINYVQAMLNQQGCIEVIARGGDGYLRFIRQTAPNNGWSGLQNIPAGLYSTTPYQLGKNADGHLELGASDGKGSVYHHWQDGDLNWQGPAYFNPGPQSNAVMCFGTDGDLRIELFSIDTSGSLQDMYQAQPANPGTTWQGPGDLEGVSSSCVAGSTYAKAIEVICVNPEGQVYANTQNPAGGGFQGWGYLAPGPYSTAREAIAVGGVINYGGPGLQPANQCLWQLAFLLRQADGGIDCLVGKTTDQGGAEQWSQPFAFDGQSNCLSVNYDVDTRIEVVTINAVGDMYNLYMLNPRDPGALAT